MRMIMDEETHTETATAGTMASSTAAPHSAGENMPNVPGLDTPVLDASTLFGDRREIWIVLEGVRYRLRITRRGKLILQK